MAPVRLPVDRLADELTRRDGPGEVEPGFPHDVLGSHHVLAVVRTESRVRLDTRRGRGGLPSAGQRLEQGDDRRGQVLAPRTLSGSWALSNAGMRSKWKVTPYFLGAVTDALRAFSLASSTNFSKLSRPDNSM